MLFLILVCVHVYIGHLYQLLLNFDVCTCAYWTHLSVALNSGVCVLMCIMDICISFFEFWCVYMCMLDNLISVVLNSGVCEHVYIGQLGISCSKFWCVCTCVYWTPISVALNFGVCKINGFISFSFLKFIRLHFKVLTINHISQDSGNVTEIIHLYH